MTEIRLRNRPRRPTGRQVGLMMVGFAVVAAIVAGGLGSVAGPAVGQSAATSALLAGDQLEWTVPTVNGPPALDNASAVFDSDSQTVVLFGGERANGSLSNDTWVWNGSGWTDYPGSSTPAPAARELAAMAFDPTLHQLILFGGQGVQGQPFGDTWAWNGASWYQLDAMAVETPQPRLGATMSLDGAGHLILFGGTGYPNPTPPTTTTTPTTAPAGTAAGVEDGSGGPVSTTTTNPPPAAGEAGDAPGTAVALSDTWIWTATGWTPTSASGPTGRSLASMAYDSSLGQTVLFGGQSNPVGTSNPKLLSDTWTWNGSKWTRARPAATPPARVGATLADEPQLDGAVLFSGDGTNSVLDDTWVWSGSNWLPARPAATPSGRTGAAVAYDTTSGTVVMFGGSTGGLLAATTELLAATPAPPTPPTTRPTSTPSTTVAPKHPTPKATVPKKPVTHKKPIVGPTPIPAAVLLPPVTAPLASTAHTAHRGSRVTLSGTGFMPGAMVTITFHSTPVVLDRLSANPDGRFTVTVAVPSTAAMGGHHFEASGLTPKGGTAVLVAAVDVIGSPANDNPTATEKAVLVAAVLVMPGGAWLLMAGAGWQRRRRTGPATTN